MDRRRTRSRVLRIAASIILLASAAAAPDPPLRALHWTAPGRELAAMTRKPPECLHRAADAQTRQAIEIGRAAFRTPLLLGGQAARLGIACETCHQNGRGNPAFFFPGLSDAPGTADVTASLMSSHRGNGTFDPRPIPDLAHPQKVSRDAPALDHFIHGLIVEEFDGPEPPPRVLAGVAAYVRALDPAQCPAAGTVPITLDRYLDDVARALAAAQASAAQGDAPTARLMLASARTALGLIDERYAAAGLTADRARLRKADTDLLALQHALDAGTTDVAARIAAFAAGSARRLEPLRRDEGRSLFNPDMLRKSI